MPASAAATVPLTAPAPSPTDALAAFKDKQRKVWATFAVTATFTIPAAARLVRFAGVQAGDRVLDVGSGTGNVAITAAAEGANVVASDLTPELLAQIPGHAHAAGVTLEAHEADVESLPFPDASFDVVLSQFGHMFAPRPDVAVAEMLRVLKPGGRIAFSTWPPGSLPGKVFDFQARFMPLPPGVAPFNQWGDIDTIRARLGDRVDAIGFERGTFSIPGLGARHFQQWQEANLPPIRTAFATLASDPAAAGKAREDLVALLTPFHDGNEFRHDYLMTRATKRT